MADLLTSRSLLDAVESNLTKKRKFAMKKGSEGESLKKACLREIKSVSRHRHNVETLETELNAGMDVSAREVDRIFLDFNFDSDGSD